ncbi:MAG TPA: bifunctional 5,10-methylene-tetrahydrofolate dehydrogenase/5,10-methylene-tetrahydrofolate cyclohydrolase, partial [Spirochaetota bacterium]|nr:bifunctional 5,10-methylene-tetrahydrofolate dehydrogenase/5,10-methylene-tetrahydrofolate cyclohydrolase [Spirochaetota bacterium]
KKDLDGISYINQGMLFSGHPFLIPATAWACDITLQHIEKEYSYPLKGKNAVIIGRSLTVGKPAFHLLLQRDITPSIIHTKSVDKEMITKNADIIIATCGVPEIVTASWLKENSVVLDVGIHCIECNVNKTFKLCGDVNANSALHKAMIVTAVPGGIGVVTSSLLFANALKSYYKTVNDKTIDFEFQKKI